LLGSGIKPSQTIEIEESSMQHLEFSDYSPNRYSGSKPGINRWAGAILLLCTLALSACGGGGGGSSPPAETSSNCVIGSSTIGDCKI